MDGDEDRPLVTKSTWYDYSQGFILLLSVVIVSLSITTVVLVRDDHTECPPLYSPNYGNPNLADLDLQPKGTLLVKNCILWTGGTSLLENPMVGLQDVLIEKGVITAVGSDLNVSDTVITFDATGRHCTPGLVDMHTHLGVSSIPTNSIGNSDGGEQSDPLMPFLRVSDAIDTEDPAIELMRSQGVTSCVILPISNNMMGGEALMIKLRPPPKYPRVNTISSLQIPGSPRVLKFACGENPKLSYGSREPPEFPTSRMGIAYGFRKAFDRAQRDASMLQSCKQTNNGLEPSTFLETEPLIALMRGEALAYIHCYKSNDMLTLLEISKTFSWKISSFHHALEAWKIADILARENITVATFAQHSLVKMETYKQNPAAPSILTKSGVPVAFKSDHPAYTFGTPLYRQVGMAIHHGFDMAYAIPSVTSIPANAMKLGDKLGKIEKGFDGDLVIWNTKPTSSRARAKTVILDGIITIDKTEIETFPDPKYSKGSCDKCTVSTTFSASLLALVGINEMITLVDGVGSRRAENILIREGVIECIGTGEECPPPEGYEVINFMGNSVAVPGFISVGAGVANKEIMYEPNTHDGDSVGPLTETLIAVDGALPHIYEGKAMSLARGTGVSAVVFNPSSSGVIQGIASSVFTTGDMLPNYGIIAEQVSLVVTIGNSAKTSGEGNSISGQIELLRVRLVNGTGVWQNVVGGSLPLMIRVQQRDNIAALLRLHSTTCPNASFIFMGALEAHFFAKEIASKSPRISVLLGSYKPFTFETYNAVEEAFRILYFEGARVALAGPSLMNDVDEIVWLPYEAAFLTSQKGITRDIALKAISKDVASIVGLDRFNLTGDLSVGSLANVVVWSGDPLEYTSQILFYVFGPNAGSKPHHVKMD
eukprot:TRINITY_DN11385_c0_g1_i1.p1 TRINITY_DN11385_c0_g1~~TRINITY_DN11385_c0_g1_i1.p1  ORF type:complete len:882 (-),score=144.19 TRINITY_DN11385_c0_g1_i1:84-2729(-)